MNVHQVPRMEKIVVNMASARRWKRRVEDAAKDLSQIHRSQAGHQQVQESRRQFQIAAKTSRSAAA